MLFQEHDCTGKSEIATRTAVSVRLAYNLTNTEAYGELDSDYATDYALWKLKNT